MKTFLKKIVKSVHFPAYLTQLQDAWQEEQRKRQEFYQNITEEQKAEFINGEVIIHSPVKRSHNEVGKRLLKQLDDYVSTYMLGFVGYEKLLIKLTRNDYEPDICYFSSEQEEKLAEDCMFFPAPVFVVEILSPSTEKNDRNIKFNDYAAHGVQEYWIIDPKKRIVEQYVLENGSYSLVFRGGHGAILSPAVPGFVLSAETLFDKTKFMEVLLKPERTITALKQELLEKDEILSVKDKELLEKDKLIRELMEKLQAK